MINNFFSHLTDLVARATSWELSTVGRAFDQWTDLANIGPIYPMVGSEGFLVVIGVLLWLLWHAWQISTEDKEWQDDLQKFGGKQLPRDEYHL